MAFYGKLEELICANALNIIDVPELDPYSHYCMRVTPTPKAPTYIITEKGVKIETEGPMVEIDSWYVGGELDGMANNGTDLFVLEAAVKRIVRYTTDGNTNVNEFDMSTLRENFHAIDYVVPSSGRIYAFGVYGGRRRIYYKRKVDTSWSYVVVRTNDGTVLNAPGGMAIGKTRMYISNLNIIWRGRAYNFHPQSSALSPWLRLPSGFVITAMSLDDDYIYAYERSKKIVLRINIITKEYQIYFIPAINDIQGMTVLDKKFYMSDVATKKIHVFQIKPKKLVR